jgi:hypothetical protein
MVSGVTDKTFILAKAALMLGTVTGFAQAADDRAHGIRRHLSSVMIAVD